MSADIRDLMTSLASLMEEETEILRVSPYKPELEETAAAKARLSSDLANLTLKLNRETPGWRDGQDEEERADLAGAARRLMNAAQENADTLRRNLELSGDLMETLIASAKKGRRGGVSVYGQTGNMTNSRGGPLSVNANL